MERDNVSEAENGAISGTSQIALKIAESTTQPEAASSGNFAVQRLGQVTFQSGDTLQANLSWNGGGHVMLLYTDKDYEAKVGQKLFLIVDSNIRGGSVDIFLFSPSYAQQRITIGGSDTIKTIELSVGTWAYNCTGFLTAGTLRLLARSHSMNKNLLPVNLTRKSTMKKVSA